MNNTFVHSNSSKKIISETDIMKMLEFLIDNLFVMFDVRVLSWTVDILFCIDCVPVLG
jgi:hypothetical protein